MLGDFSSRELASVAWGSLLLLVVLRSKVLREGLFAVFKVIFTRPIIKWSSLMITYVCLICYLFNQLGMWRLPDIKPTFLWLISAGLYMVYRSVKETPSPAALVGGIFREGFNIAVILEFLVSKYTFSIYLELVLVPVAFFLIFISSPSKTDDPRAKLAVNFANSALSWIGLFLLVRSLVIVVTELSDFWSFQTAHAFLLPMALSLSFLPFLWIVLTHTAYGHVFMRLGVFSKSLEKTTCLKFWMFWEFGFRYYEVWNWWQYYVIEKPEGYNDIKQSLALSKDFKLKDE